MSGYVTHSLVGIPLSPIHVGGGDDSLLRPDQYRIGQGEDSIELFDIRQAMALLPPEKRLRLARQIVNADTAKALQEMRAAIPAKAITNKVGLSESSGRELSKNPHQRKGQVNLMIRDGDMPIIPGTSLKGAFRTAAIGAFGRDLNPYPGRERGAVKAAHTALVRNALAIDPKRMETDPFRDVRVRDIQIPASTQRPTTRIDQIQSWKRQRDGYDFDTVGQMHWERLMSVMDGGAPPLLQIEVDLRSAKDVQTRAKYANRNGRLDPVASDLSFWLKALNAQHKPIWEEDLRRFFAKTGNRRLTDALALFGTLDLSSETPTAALVRIGRAGHAEAKSIEGHRNLQRHPQEKDPTKTYGKTRHVIELPGRTPAPFGWMLLVRRDHFQPPKTWLSAPAQTARPSTPTPAAAPTLSDASLVMRAGTQVLVNGEPGVLAGDIRRGQAEVDVDFDGEIEPARVSDIKENKE